MLFVRMSLMEYSTGNAGQLFDRLLRPTYSSAGVRLLVNTSGSGKTRLLFEGLSRHWGFYFTSAHHVATNPYGSTDLTSIILEDIPFSRCFCSVPESVPENERDATYKYNYHLARRHMFQVIQARLIVFEYFWNAIQNFPQRDINEFKMHWLFLQLFPHTILGEDVFRNLTMELKHADTDYLKMSSLGLDVGLAKLSNRIDIKEDFIIVLDEAQVLGEQMPLAFQSADPSVQCPVLKPIVNALLDASELPIIVSGTGLSMDLVNEGTSSTVSKRSAFRLTTHTGSFINRDQQCDYIMRYVPQHIVESEAGKALIERAWRWVRGRYVVIYLRALELLLKCSLGIVLHLHL